MLRRALVLLSCGALLSCSSSVTELVVVVETNLAVPDDLDRVDIIVIGPTARSVESEPLVGDGAPTFPLTVAVYPATDVLDVEVVAVGLKDDAEVVRTSARTTLVDGDSRTLHLVLLRGCIGRSCASNETCAPGGCRPVLQTDLPNWNGTPPTYVEMDPCDSAPWDVDGDMVGSVECGGADCDDANAEIGPDIVEACDGIDNDCDGENDPAECACTEDGAVQSCTTSCGSVGEQTCMGGSFGPCEVLPEMCNAIDDDCDGSTDEGFDYVPLGPDLRLTDDTSDSGPPRILHTGDRWAMVWADRLPFMGSEDQGTYYAALDADGTVALGPMPVSPRGHSPDFAWNGSVFGLVYVRRDSSTACCPTGCPDMCTTNSDRVFVRTFDMSGMTTADPFRVDGDVDTNPQVRVVWDGTSFVTTWDDGDMEIQRFDEAGMEIGPDTDIPMSWGDEADFVWNGSQFAIVWTRADEVMFKTDVSTVFAMPSLEVYNSRRTETAALDATSTGFMLGWFFEERDDPMFDRQIGLELLAVDSTGMPGSMTTTNLSRTVGGQGFDEDYPRTPTIRAAPGQLLVTWSDQRDADLEIYFARVSESGEILQAATRLTTAVGDSDGTSVAWDGSQFGVAWQDHRDGNPEVYFNRLGCGP